MAARARSGSIPVRFAAGSATRSATFCRQPTSAVCPIVVVSIGSSLRRLPSPEGCHRPRAGKPTPMSTASGTARELVPKDREPRRARARCWGGASG